MEEGVKLVMLALSSEMSSVCVMREDLRDIYSRADVPLEGEDVFTSESNVPLEPSGKVKV